MPKVEREWAGETAVIVAGGPSLTREDVDFVRGRARVIAINNAYQLAPWADVFYACDARWWREHYKAVAKLPGRKFSLNVPGTRKPDDVICLRKTGRHGLETECSGLRHGHNSGYQCIGLARHLGVARIVLLGYDMRLGTGGRAHWHGAHPWPLVPSFNTWIGMYRTLVAPLQAEGIEVLNCTRTTNLDAFPLADLRDVLASREAAA